ncbi:hypothetical protein DLREEDagrD3_14880 [Denitratisoma sp. agr-D3]
MKSLRLLFLLLILANAAVLAWQTGPFGGDDGREPQRLDDQRNADKLRLVTAKDADDNTKASTADTPPPQDAAVSPPASPQAAAETAKAGPLCRLLTGFKLADARQWTTAIANKLPEAKLTVQPTDAAASYEVLIAALAGRDGVDAKLKELKALGITAQPRTVPDGPDKFALVFASHGSEAEAKSALQGLMEKGVRTARVVPRFGANALATVEVRNLDAAHLKDLKEQLAGRNDVRISECQEH